MRAPAFQPQVLVTVAIMISTMTLMLVLLFMMELLTGPVGLGIARTMLLLVHARNLKGVTEVVSTSPYALSSLLPLSSSPVKLLLLPAL